MGGRGRRGREEGERVGMGGGGGELWRLGGRETGDRLIDRVKKCFSVSRRNGIAGNPWDNNFWLDLDFLDVARAAQRCSAYFTSLLYIEIWHGAREDHAHSSGSRDLADEEVGEILSLCGNISYAYQ